MKGQQIAVGLGMTPAAIEDNILVYNDMREYQRWSLRSEDSKLYQDNPDDPRSRQFDRQLLIDLTELKVMVRESRNEVAALKTGLETTHREFKHEVHEAHKELFSRVGKLEGFNLRAVGYATGASAATILLLKLLFKI